MASQPRVGLLPERRAGNCTGHSDHPAATGSDLGGRALLVSRTENGTKSGVRDDFRIPLITAIDQRFVPFTKIIDFVP